jgi:myo-inositol 2-dehydrogenase/D-chiro-inositol 1-dehydrogenase
MVHDVNGAAAVAVGDRLGVAHTTDVDAVFGSDDVDAVAICSSTDTHVPLLFEAARCGKAIFCEKPISLDLGRVDEALAIVREAGVPIQIGFNRRFDAAHKSVRDAVADGLLGDVHVVRITSRDPAPPPIEYVKVSGGIFLDMMVHDFDMARYVTGSEVVEVHALGAVRIDPAIGEAGDVDTAAVMLRHDDGCITMIDNSRRAVYGYDQRVEAFGSGGMAASDNPLAHTGVRRTAAGTSAPLLPFFFLDRYIPSYIAQWLAFRDYVDGGGASPVTAEDGRAPLVIGLAAWRSLREHRPVAISEIT